MAKQDLQYAYYNSPIGTIEVAATKEGIQHVEFTERKKKPKHTLSALDDAIAQLQEYFDGKRQEFNLMLAPEGTEFQQSVWSELQKIPFGKTCSYLDIANSLGDKNATRAVGAANGRNKIAIITPCHRVIGADGSLTGYASGLDRKQFLLELEGVIPKQTSLF